MKRYRLNLPMPEEAKEAMSESGAGVLALLSCGCRSLGDAYGLLITICEDSEHVEANLMTMDRMAAEMGGSWSEIPTPQLN